MSKITRLASGEPPPGGAVQTIQGNQGGPVPPNAGNNIFIVGDETTVDVIGNPGGNTLTITTPGLPHTFFTDNDPATAAANAIAIVGDLNITTFGSGAVVQITLDQNVSIAGFFEAGTDITSVLGNITAVQGNVVISNGNLVLGVSSGLDGQVPIAATAGNAIWANITPGSTNITITNTPNSITIDAFAGSQVVNYTNVNFAMSPYTVLVTDYYLSVDLSGGAITILLPDAPAIGRIIQIKDREGLAQVSNITVTTVGGAVTIDEQLFYDMNNNYQAVSVIFGVAGYELF